jgi:hypothetical protein
MLLGCGRGAHGDLLARYRVRDDETSTEAAAPSRVRTSSYGRLPAAREYGSRPKAPAIAPPLGSPSSARHAIASTRLHLVAPGRDWSAFGLRHEGNDGRARILVDTVELQVALLLRLARGQVLVPPTGRDEPRVDH